MTQELKNDLTYSWNETEELFTTLWELSNEDIIEHKFYIIERVKKIRDTLSKYVNEEDITELI